MTTYEPDRIFVGGLPPTCSTDDQLGAFFNTIGAVREAKVFVDLHTGRSKGFGFVTFESPSAVEAAIANDANNVIDGKWVSVKRCEQGGQTKWPGGASSVEEAGLWVRGLPLDYTDLLLRQFFEQYGQVVDCKVLPRKYPNNPDAAGLVRMGSPEQAQWCVDNLSNQTPLGFPVAMSIKFSSRASGGLQQQQQQQHQHQQQHQRGGYPGGGGGGGGRSLPIVPPHTHRPPPQGDAALTPDVIAQAAQLLANSGGSSDVIAAIANLATSAQDGGGGGGGGCRQPSFTASTPGGLPQEAGASNRLWVRGLPRGYTDEMLRELFSQFGQVSDCKVLPQKFPQNPDMAGVVRMSSLELAQWCIDNVSGTMLPGCEVPISMRFARENGDGMPRQQPQQQAFSQPQPQQVFRALTNNPNAMLNSAPPLAAPTRFSQGGGGASASGLPYHQEGGKTFEPDRIFVGGLPHSCDTETLALFFSQFGSVVDASVNTDPGTGKSKGFGFVRFQTVEAVELALLNESQNIIDGKWVRVKRCELAGSQAAGAGPVIGGGAIGSSSAASSLTHQLTAIVNAGGGGGGGGGFGGGFGGGGASASADGNPTGVWIRGLPLEYNEVSLKAFFEQYVEVFDCKVLPRRFPNNPDQAGLVRLASHEMAQWCIDTLNGTQPPGFPLPISCKLSTSTAPVRSGGQDSSLPMMQSSSPAMLEAPQNTNPLPPPADPSVQDRVSSIIASVVAETTAAPAPQQGMEMQPAMMAQPQMSQPVGMGGEYGGYGGAAPPANDYSTVPPAVDYSAAPPVADYGAAPPAPPPPPAVNYGAPPPPAVAYNPALGAPPAGAPAMDYGGEKRPMDGGYEDPQAKFQRMA